MSTVLVRSGSYRNIPIINTEFKLVKGFQTGKSGNWITVENAGMFPNQSSLIRIKVEDQHDFEFTAGDAPANVSQFVPKAPVVQETDEEAMDRIATRFAILEEMAKATTNGGIRAMIVSGPPGVGKSFGVEQQ